MHDEPNAQESPRIVLNTSSLCNCCNEPVRLVRVNTRGKVPSQVFGWCMVCPRCDVGDRKR